MGWIDENHVEHEGYVLALITHEATEQGSGIYRALCFPTDRESQPFERVGSECACGWRSWHWEPLHRSWKGADGVQSFLEWAPFSPTVSPVDEERAYRLWRKHVNDVDTEKLLVGDGSQEGALGRSPGPS